MNRSIRWLLTESKISNLNPDEINLSGNKLICYHLTSHKNWELYNPDAKRLLLNPEFVGPKEKISADDSRAVRILKKIKNKRRVQKTSIGQVEELVIMDMIDDPYTDTSGFSPGRGDYHGKGLYTCYKFNPSIAKFYGDICLVFEMDISRFLILAEDLAKTIHGENWTIKDQLIKLYSLNYPDSEKIETFKKNYDSFLSPDNLKMSKTINSDDRTAGTSQKIIKFFGKENITSLYDGIILFGENDGPVCVSFYPKYDAKIIGLGRLDEKSETGNVDWYDSVDNFVGGIARNKLDFETMNAIAEENTDPIEKSQMKEKERPEFDPDVDIRAAFDSREIYNVIEIYNNADQTRKEKIEDYFFKGGDDIWFYPNVSIPDSPLNNSFHNQMFLNVLGKTKESDTGLKQELTDLFILLISHNIQLSETLIKFALDFIYSKDYEKESGRIEWVKQRQDDLLVSLSSYLKSFSLSSELENKIKSEVENKSLDAIKKYEDFLFSLENNKITPRGIQTFLRKMNFDNYLRNYMVKQLSQNEIKKFVDVILNYCNNPKIKNLTPDILNFVLFFIFKEDIVLSRQEQEIFISKIAKSHYNVKELFSKYKHIESDCFIKLFEADLKKGGMGSGRVYSNFHTSPNIYKLLYQHKEIVSLFARSAKSGVMRSIIKNVTLGLQGNNVPLSESAVFQSYEGYFTFTSSVDQEIDLSDAQWFNYFLNTMRTSPSIKMLKKPLNELEKAMRQNNMISDVPSLELNQQNQQLSTESIIRQYIKTLL